MDSFVASVTLVARLRDGSTFFGAQVGSLFSGAQGMSHWKVLGTALSPALGEFPFLNQSARMRALKVDPGWKPTVPSLSSMPPCLASAA